MTHALSTKTASKPEFAQAGTKQTAVPECPACSHKRGFEIQMARVYECGACHAVYGSLYLGDSYGYVLPHFGNDSAEITERQRYFDFTCVGSKGVTRRHGWFDPCTKLLTQVG